MRQKFSRRINVLFVLIVFSFPASYAMADEGTSEGASWEGSASLGMSLTSGNSETLMINGAVSAERATEKSKLLLGVQGNYGETEVTYPDTANPPNEITKDETTTKDAKAYGQYNRTVTDRLYWLVASSIEYDDIAAIDYRWTLGPGLGVYLIKTDKTSLGVEAGPSYIREKVGGVEDDVAALRLGERFDHNLSETAKIWQAAEYLANFEDFEAYLLNAEVGVEAALMGDLSLRVVLQDKYNSAPPEGSGLKKNDVALIAALVYKFSSP